MFNYQYNTKLSDLEKRRIIDKIVKEFWKQNYYYICF